MRDASSGCRRRSTPGEGEPVEAEIIVDGLDGIWMPTAGQLASVDFAGSRAASLADRFYYSAGRGRGGADGGRGTRVG